ncbi:MAG TPA: hypothetical protein VE130_13620, partial [Nitrososphaeraceae archaeon]|nr:hypothetical protein [Nitrososphaeraceae archaeon]
MVQSRIVSGSALSLLVILILNVPSTIHYLYATTDGPEIPGSIFSEGSGAPSVADPNLQVEPLFTGLEFPTNMALLGPDDFLVTEKSKGTVNRIVNGTMSEEPLLQVNVTSEVERGMLGIAVSNATDLTGIESNNIMMTNATGPYVFLYYTEAASAQD